MISSAAEIDAELKNCAAPCRERACPFRLHQTENKIQTQKDSLDLNSELSFLHLILSLVPTWRNRQACSLRATKLRLTPQFIDTSSVSLAADTFPSSSARGRQGAPISVRCKHSTAPMGGASAFVLSASSGRATAISVSVAASVRC